MEKFNFFRSFLDTARAIEDESLRLRYLMAVAEYWLEGKESDDPMVKALMVQTQFVLDRSKELKNLKSECMKWNNNAVKNYENILKQRKTVKNSKKQKKQEIEIEIEKEDISKDISKKEKMFELFWKQYPHYRQWKKQESKNFFLKQDPDKVLKQAAVYKRQVLSWIKDRQFVPACQRWIRDFTELSDDVIRQDLKQVVKRHLGAEWDKHDRYEKLKQDFPDVNFNEIAKEISREKWLIKMTFT